MPILKFVSLGLIFVLTVTAEFPAVYNFIPECPTRTSPHPPDSLQPFSSPVFPILDKDIII